MPTAVQVPRRHKKPVQAQAQVVAVVAVVDQAGSVDQAAGAKRVALATLLACPNRGLETPHSTVLLLAGFQYTCNILLQI